MLLCTTHSQPASNAAVLKQHRLVMKLKPYTNVTNIPLNLLHIQMVTFSRLLPLGSWMKWFCTWQLLLFSNRNNGKQSQFSRCMFKWFVSSCFFFLFCVALYVFFFTCWMFRCISQYGMMHISRNRKCFIRFLLNSSK